jgi:very-short-patch-repair endonuclease
MILIEFDGTYHKVYRERNDKKPGFIETWAFEGMRLSLNILVDSKFEQREDLERKIVNLQKLVGITGKWNLKEGLMD